MYGLTIEDLYEMPEGELRVFMEEYTMWRAWGAGPHVKLNS